MNKLQTLDVNKHRLGSFSYCHVKHTDKLFQRVVFLSVDVAPGVIVNVFSSPFIVEPIKSVNPEQKH